ncbi:restriction endonuclease [Streptomyces europaeiscabiei]|uniref:restriction endonuclease n=1 Tax=Streptomyces europaeiscabiei TaxID=146819 RepID=UPI0029BE1031|nr:restriction endonuclease [Streptomyces europaeiscabiei]MDX3580264.1 restriction endonuclease [Streptomyces europaeiscabiei]MDX3618024.1 restriction endonuclease [Streptomyces europaeiscabiei]MDX3631202.1 restriction endonuclease [Streptomyces europaeiscabiei]MDX3647682.1 restriction endonuclease [Streptomyces europaeiscabiei]WUD32363.1 restriction endonuclease [Streptomyces europaeiscabiei]
MSRRSNGLAGIWAEAQRQQQRQSEEQARQQREYERQQRAYQREVARSQREQQAAYRQQREAEARRRTEELDAQVQALEGLLVAGCRAPAFRSASLTRTERLEPFSPGPLAQPVPMPDPNHYQAQGGWTAQRRAQAQAEARARFEHDWHAAQAAETQRQRQLAQYQRQYEQWAQGQRAEIRRHNAGLAQMATALRDGDPEAAVDYFSAALYASPAWPEGFPRGVSAAYDSAARQLVLDWELPRYDVVPEAKTVVYMPSVDQDKERPRPVTQRRALYRDVLAQCALLVLHDLFAADEFGALESVVLNGFVDDHDPATGRRAQIFLATVMVPRSVFAGLHLEQVSAVDCLTDGLRGQLSARPDQRTPVRPGRRPDDVGNGVVTHGGEDEPDLLEMDPLAFESLVAELFRAMGMQAVTTQRSGDGGVDVDALDPAPIRGGKIVVQVKRYRNTVPPTAVRDLYGTVQDAGANKGVLVTTSKFGPGSHTFANGKPLELVSGRELVDLLHRHGLRGRLGTGERPAAAPVSSTDPTVVLPAQRTAADTSNGADPAPATDDHSVLGMYWTGGVALDVCALVCHGNRVLSDDHFVFYNNLRTPDGTVRAVPPTAPDKAAIQVSFDTLPAEADRLVLVAAIDPAVNPDADLSGFTDAGIRLLDPSRAEQGRLEVSDGRADETALTLGSFRRRANGDWDFVVGGKGYRGGLEELVQDHGIEVA